MSDCDQFHHGSRQREICEGTSGLPRYRENLFRVRHGIEPLPDEPRIENTASTATVASVRVVQRSREPRKTCGSCGSKPRTPRTPRTPREPKTTPSRIKNTAHPVKVSLLSRAAQYALAMARHIADDATPTSPNDLAFRESCCASCPHNVDDTCTLCTCPLRPNSFNAGKLAWRSESCPVGKWFRQTDEAMPLVDPIRNLVFHIFPRVGCEWNWHRHVQHIIDNEAIWNGKRVISIGTGDGLASPETVKRQFGDVRVDHWVVMPNSPTLGETEPFIPSLKLIESVDPNEITMYGHTKGITHPIEAKEQVWSEMMWAVCLDLPSVYDALASHAMAGPFKRHMKFAGTNYHYSGGFFWLRHKDIFSRPKWTDILQGRRSGMEFWPEKVCPNHLAAPLFHDDPPLTFLSEDYWAGEVIPDFQNWQSARIK